MSQVLQAGHSERHLLRATLALSVLVGAFVRFHDLGAHSVGNLYYAATVRSMLSSWHNFFFASFEPGGSVSVDKPPVGFWIQAASAALFGVNGFALAMPQALAGVLSIVLLYGLVRSQFGQRAAVVAALVLALTPVTVATERNNTIDGVLVFLLLAAALAFWRATQSGRLCNLLIGAALVGLGFNVKMLQAFMPLPAFYALYLLGSRLGWWRRIAYAAVSALVMVAISASWALVVDLTPPDQRPFVGSSTDNTVRQLILGHNGLARLRLGPFGGGGPIGGPGAPLFGPYTQPGPDTTGYVPSKQGLAAPPGTLRSVPSQPSLAPLPGPILPQGPAMGPAPPGPQPNGPNQEVGEPGLWRLVREPLVTEASWLLPLAMLGIPLAALRLGRTGPWQALLLWGIWLLVEVAYFSFTSGIFHVYYLSMLGPPLAALVGVAVWALGEEVRQRRWVGRALLSIVSGGTVAFAIAALQPYPDFAAWVAPVAVVFWLVGMAIFWCTFARRWAVRVALALVLVSLLVAPAAWSFSVALNDRPEVGLPHARPRVGPGAGAPDGPRVPPPGPPPKPPVKVPGGGPGPSAFPGLGIGEYLLANTPPQGYLAAAHTAQEAAPLILATGRPVLTMGGFSGSDHVVDVQRLSDLVALGKLRFVLGGARLADQKPQIAAWLARACGRVTFPGPGPLAGGILYDCQPP